MTYAQFLLLFLLVPIVVLVALVLRDRSGARKRGTEPIGWAPLLMVLALMVVAMLYTTPWDNALIANRVWWYAPERVSGITVGWIPLEELSFFLLQTLLIGLWFLWLIPRLGRSGSDAEKRARALTDDKTGGYGQSDREGSRVRVVAATAGAGLWMVALGILLGRWRPGTYIGWELIWALPPIILQLSLGADILWRHRRLAGAVLVPMVLYLCVADALAIRAGIWTIDPRQSLGILVGGWLPLEEVVFFSLTTMLVAFGLVLGLAAETGRRLHAYRARLSFSLARR
ncbi:MAG: lycopene cyclase domain-containing protein [Nitrososphaerota archaeon]